MSQNTSRRAFNAKLREAAIGLALAPWGAAFAQNINNGVNQVDSTSLAQASNNKRKWQVQPFTLGVASGVPRHNCVVLWTRLIISPADAQVSDSSKEPLWVGWELYADEQLKRLIKKGSEFTNEDRGHSVRVLVSDLEPSTNYWYRFVSGDATSRVGRTKTAPSPSANVQSLRFALASCQHFEAGQYTAYKDIAQQDLDFVLFVGDYIYETNLNERLAVRRHIGSEPKSLEEYRSRYELYKSDPHLQAAHAAHPWVLMWDDHEVVNDYANDLDPAYSDPTVFLKRRAAAYRAYFEHQPLWLGPDSQSREQASMRLHDCFQWGQLAELWTLDCRQFRSHHACSKPGSGGGRLVLSCDELADPSRTMLGFEQEAWLNEGLSASTRQWKLLAQGTQISSTRIFTPLGRATYTEAWDGYATARERLLKGVQSNQISNVITLGGDVHMNVAANLRLEANEESSPIIASEFVTTSISSRGLSESATQTIKANNSDILHMRADERGYALIQVDPQRVQCEFRTTPTPAGSLESLSVQAVYYVETGQPGPKRLA